MQTTQNSKLDETASPAKVPETVSHLRYDFCEAANAVRMHDADCAAFYDRKFREARKHKHKRAIVLTARKLVRLVVRLLTTNQPYRPRRPEAPTP